MIVACFRETQKRPLLRSNKKEHLIRNAPIHIEESDETVHYQLR